MLLTKWFLKRKTLQGKNKPSIFLIMVHGGASRFEHIKWEVAMVNNLVYKMFPPKKRIYRNCRKFSEYNVTRFLIFGVLNEVDSQCATLKQTGGMVEQRVLKEFKNPEFARKNYSHFPIAVLHEMSFSLKIKGIYFYCSMLFLLPELCA